MQDILQLLNSYSPYIIIILVILNLILISVVVLDHVKIRRMQQQYNKFMNKDDLDLQTLLEQNAIRMKEIEDHEMIRKHTLEEIKEISLLINGCKKYFLQQYFDNENVINKIFTPVNKLKAEEYLKYLKANNINAFLRNY
ncbi:MAG: hypothetical protein ATN32_01615 [Candidatus Epulonipiscium fishelsonii]|nr:MAG: hypothetical protein ATN32_01615 [Epulopiscium sp. AS2M-Bin002]